MPEQQCGNLWCVDMIDVPGDAEQGVRKTHDACGWEYEVAACPYSGCPSPRIAVGVDDGVELIVVHVPCGRSLRVTGTDPVTLELA